MHPKGGRQLKNENGTKEGGSKQEKWQGHEGPGKTEGVWVWGREVSVSCCGKKFREKRDI